MLTQDQRKELIASLESENKAALSAPRIMDGAISSTQINRMGKREYATWQANVQKGFEVRAQIKELQKSDAQIASESAAKAADERQSKIESSRRYMALIESLGGMSHLSNGKLRKSYQLAWDIEVAKLSALGVTL